MGILRNFLGSIVPIRERREAAGTLNALNAELVLDVNGDESASILLLGSAATLNCTVEFTGSVDGVNFMPVLALPYQGTSAAAPPSNAQPLIVEAINTTNVVRQYMVRCGQLKKLRVRLSVFASGSADVYIVSDACRSLHPALSGDRPTSLVVTATAAVGVALTTTLPAVAGLRHHIDFIYVSRFATALLTAGSAPVLVTTTNMPGTPVIPFPAEAAPQGTETVRQLDFGGTGLATTTLGTASTTVCPATTGVIWRATIAYRLGL
jgi:hypothetical protein